MVGEPFACALDTFTVSVFAVLVRTCILIEELKEVVDFLFPSEAFISYFLS
jgi:hypothetical protein